MSGHRHERRGPHDRRNLCHAPGGPLTAPSMSILPGQIDDFECLLQTTMPIEGKAMASPPRTKHRRVGEVTTRTRDLCEKLRVLMLRQDYGGPTPVTRT